MRVETFMDELHFGDRVQLWLGLAVLVRRFHCTLVGGALRCGLETVDGLDRFGTWICLPYNLAGRGPLFRLERDIVKKGLALGALRCLE